ncbi:penicillin-binding protein 1C [Bacteroides sp. 224]|uniref:penicillin-binding protein 1C n=1 Tax=Bacteroides sp. 224 TaxID=2302936 RepID=UPI001EF20DD1|nr:penicillin-binding protein 1C [Bacteroides sp. 224]
MKTSRKIGCLIAIILLVLYMGCLPGKLFDVSYSTVVTDRNGELLGARIANDGQWRFPACDTVPLKLKACIIEFEDRHYYQHWGVNPLAVGRAIKQNLQQKRIVSGGSTITMQTIRLSRNKARTLGEKVVEAILATRLEFSYSKEEILAMYASHAPYGGNVVGLDAASWRYFGHAAKELSWAEAATLAVLPNSPSMMHLSKSRQALKNKRDRLLKRLFEKKTIDDITYELALEEELPDEPLPLPQVAPHLVAHLYKTKRGQESASTIDKGIQIRVEEVVERWNDEFTKSDIKNLAAIVLDVQTGEVVAYCGNARFEEKRFGNQVDVIRSPRSSGSILKPFLYYVMLQEGEILPATLLPDIPVNINGFTPQNFSRQFEGAVPAGEAIARSLNIPSVHLLREYSVPKFHDFLKQIGLKTLTRPSAHYGLSLILGGAEVTLWDVTAAYADMARALQNLDRVPFALLLSEIENRKSQPPLFKPGAVWQTFNAIKEVNRPEEIDWRLIPSMQTVAWKTGTSYGFRDAWAVGVTPRYAVGVWVGNAAGEGKPGLVGARTAGPVMFDIFNLLPSSDWFSTPYSEFTEAEVCRKSGHIKSRFCEETDSILILPAGFHTDPCSYHHSVTLSADERYRLYADCAENEPVVLRNWFTLPPAWEWYYKQHHLNYKSLPPFRPGCGEDMRSPMQFIYPQMNANVFLPKQLDGTPGAITFDLAHTNRRASVYWHLDGAYIDMTQDFHKISLMPEPGKHAMTVVDEEGNTLSVTFFVQSRKKD